MQLKTIFVGASLSASLAVADDVLPRQNAAQISAAANAELSYFAAITTQPVYLSLSSVLATNSAESSQVNAWLESVFSQTGAVPATVVNALPTVAQAFGSSLLSAQNSIATANGFSAVVSKAGAQPTGVAALGAAGAAAAGFVGIVLAL
ncbi:hypothetical protein G7Y89_g260 [Cudoniella acicularis]|uniref:Uncharacterized protein n=1 Tax=Cudoniella acicularis TaxID=354080 RepID=A0A8H4RYI2_9HELO|nr:hypothetical protein G7Y89_g260 [Cudoniella acicularis]